MNDLYDKMKKEEPKDYIIVWPKWARDKRHQWSIK